MAETREDDVMKDSTEPEVTKAVLHEIKRIGDNTKQMFTDVQEKYTELKGLLDKAGETVDASVKERINKLSEEILLKQDELDRKAHKRIDDIEVAFQRVPQGASDAPDELKEATEFKLCQLIGHQRLTSDGVRPEDVDIDEFKAYKKALNKFIRRDKDPLSPEEIKALSVGIDPDGGYLVTPAISARIIRKIYETDPIRQLATVETISTGAIEISVDRDEADSGGWVGELQARTETGTPQIGLIRIPVHEQFAEPRASQVFLEDAAVNVEAWLADKVANKFSRVEGIAFISGTGVHQPRGILTYGAGTAWGQIEQIPMLAAATITTDGLINVLFSMLEAYRGGATWVMNRLAIREIMKLKDGDGQYIWRVGIAQEVPSTLLGHSIRMSTTMPIITNDTLSVALANWREAYTIVDRLGITTIRDIYTAKPQVKFYTRKRVGGDVVNYDAIKIGKVSAS